MHAMSRYADKLDADSSICYEVGYACENSFEVRAILTNSNNGILPAKMVEIDGKRHVSFDVSSKIELSSYIEDHVSSYSDALSAMRGIVDAIETVESFLLDGNKCIMESDKIYYDVAEKKILFVYDVARVCGSFGNSRENGLIRGPVSIVNMIITNVKNLEDDDLAMLVKLRRKSSNMYDFESFKALITEGDTYPVNSGRDCEAGNFKANADTGVSGFDKRPDVSNVSQTGWSGEEDSGGSSRKLPKLNAETKKSGRDENHGNASERMKWIAPGISVALSASMIFVMKICFGRSVADSVIAGGISFCLLLLISIKLGERGVDSPKKSGAIDKPDKIRVSSEDLEGTVLVGECARVFCLKSRSEEVSDFVLNKTINKVGRIRTVADIFIPSGSVGRNHAELIVENGNAYVKDLNALNGTFVNSIKIPSNIKVKIKEKDVIRFATYEFELNELR